MNRRAVIRSADALARREEYLHHRFILPHLGISSWNSVALDMAASYVGLAHAESEALLEETVQKVLLHAHNSASSGFCHPVLINAMRYYQSVVRDKLGNIDIVPQRRLLDRDAQKLADSWIGSGAYSFWSQSLERNHGAGLKYVERLVQPLGLDLGTGTFSKLEGRGVRRIARMSPVTPTDLSEFVTLRGRAMHTSTDTFQFKVKNIRPGEIRQSTMRGTAVIGKMVRTVGTKLW